ncbi:Tyrosine-protein kinase [Parasponia andersonii]|uniref:Tyrosine-protein kinase n=1 Tax=Parasponia andersonii TaxID=3476 RepID=A0A2P5D2Q3_PARAD|nr:Tyrosine-protein kinase [Parasponia andersonii]
MEDSRGLVRQNVKRLARRFLNHSGQLEEERERLFLEHGSELLVELITCCKDKCRCNPIKSFTAKQVLRATNYFQHSFFDDGDSNWYKGTLDDRPVLVKKYCNRGPSSVAYRDIAISSQMSSHKNSLKLLGCCLEFAGPAIVYEDAENTHLRSTNIDGISLPWNMRLKIAKEIANAITYLHTAFARPIIHRSIRASSIFVDRDHVAKLCNFGESISIPEGETHVPDLVRGVLGYLDPVYYRTSNVTEKTDVYSFGVLLLILLTGRRVINYDRHENICQFVVNLVENERFKEIVDPKILEEGGGMNEEKELQLQDFLKLALCCINREIEERPLMIDVAKELVKIERVHRLIHGAELAHPY